MKRDLRLPLRNPWFQLFSLLAVFAGAITVYNQVSAAAYFDVGLLPGARTPSQPPGAAPDSSQAIGPGGLFGDVDTAALASPPVASESLDRVTWSEEPFCERLTIDGAPAAWSEGKRILFTTAQHGVAICGGGVEAPFGPTRIWFLLTTDGGRSWRETSALGPFFDAGFGLHFVDRYTGAAVGENGVILRTADGGETWRPQVSPVTSSLDQVALATELDGIAVGEDGVILRTANGGARWSVVPSGTTQHLRAVAFADRVTAVAVGEQGVILRTTDGGSTWQPSSSATPTSLSAVAFANETVGIAVGAGGIIVRTVDAGRTWRVVHGILAPLYGVCFSDARRAVAVAEQQVLVTDDGGENWAVHLPGGIDLVDVTCPPGGSVIAVGREYTSGGGRRAIMYSARPGPGN